MISLFRIEIQTSEFGYSGPFAAKTAHEMGDGVVTDKMYDAISRHNHHANRLPVPYNDGIEKFDIEHRCACRSLDELIMWFTEEGLNDFIVAGFEMVEYKVPEGKVEATFTKSKEQIKEEMDIVKSQLKYLGISEEPADFVTIQGLELKVIDFKRVNVVLEDKNGKTYNFKIDALRRLFPEK